MNGNRLKINKDKTQFVWLGTPHQLSRIRCQKITFGGADIHISTEAMCLGVLLDSRLTFAPHIRRISDRCFYHLRQLRLCGSHLLLKPPRQWSIHLLLYDVTTVTLSTMVQVQFTSDLCKMCSTLQLDLCVKESMTASPLTSVTFYTGCPCSNVGLLNIRSVYLSISAFTRQLHCI